MTETLRVDQLLPGELADLEAQGRIKDGVVVDAPKDTPAAPNVLRPDQIPSAPEGVKERLEAAKQLGSSFEVRDKDGKLLKASEDGGEAAAKAAPVDNPDWQGKPKEDPVDYEDKLSFLAHILGATHSHKEYALFGGQLRVTYRTRTSLEEQQCSTQAWNDDDVDGAGGTLNSAAAQGARHIRYLNYQFAASLTNMKLADGVVRDMNAFAMKGTPEAKILPVRAAYQELLKLPAPLLVVLRETHHKFENLVGKMTMAAGDSGFWKAASGT